MSFLLGFSFIHSKKLHFSTLDIELRSGEKVVNKTDPLPPPLGPVVWRDCKKWKSGARGPSHVPTASFC